MSGLVSGVQNPDSASCNLRVPMQYLTLAALEGNNPRHGALFQIVLPTVVCKSNLEKQCVDMCVCVFVIYFIATKYILKIVYKGIMYITGSEETVQFICACCSLNVISGSVESTGAYPYLWRQQWWSRAGRSTGLIGHGKFQ